MKKSLLVIFAVLFLTVVSPVMASGFHLNSIGQVDTGGIQGGKWWYTSGQPTLRGEAEPGADVVVTIDGSANQVSADSAGDWVFTPVEPLADGEHSVSLENNGSKIDFTLVIGATNVDWDQVGKGGGATLPAAGVAWPTLLLLGVGLTTVVAGGKITGVFNK